MRTTAPVRQFLEHLRYDRNLSPNTIRSYKVDLEQFFTENRDVRYVSSVTHLTIRKWLSVLHATGHAKASIARKLATLRTFFRFLVHEAAIESNPTQLIAITRKPVRLPHRLPIKDVRRLIERPNLQTDIGKRDRAILEILYATGITVSELVNLDLIDLDLENKLIRVFKQRSKQRLVPFNNAASTAVADYLTIRHNFLRTVPSSAHDWRQPLILNYEGTRITTRSIGRLITKYCPPPKGIHNVSPRTLRHSFTAHMLDAGADLRDLQQLLGHARITTTENYKALSIDTLTAVYERAMPTLPIDHANQP